MMEKDNAVYNDVYKCSKELAGRLARLTLDDGKLYQLFHLLEYKDGENMTPERLKQHIRALYNIVFEE